MEPEESAPEISPERITLRRRYEDRVEYEEEPEATHETSSDCPSGACTLVGIAAGRHFNTWTRDSRSDRREIAIKVSDYLMGMAIGALLPELIFYLSQVKIL